MDDGTLRQNIIAELELEPKLDSAGIGVAVVDGIVTLTGHVPGCAERIAAEMAVERVAGVKGVAVEIEVCRLGAVSLSDEDIAVRVLNLLKWTTLARADAIKVVVSKGWVTLTGQVQWDHQSHVAEKVVRCVRGVKGVRNAIKVRPQASSAGAAESLWQP